MNFFTEVTAKSPTKEVSADSIFATVGKELVYTTKFTMPVPGVDVIGDIDSMKMIDIFGDRLDFQSLEVQLGGQTLAENTDYTVEKDGQKVTVNIHKKYLTRGNGGKDYTIIYKVKTNDKILTNGKEIENIVKQEVDNVILPSNTVKTKVLYNKTHEYISGTPGKVLPQAVKDLLPPKQTDIPNGTRVTPEPPKNNITKVTVPEGNWIFKGYDKDFEVIDSKDAHFIGKWVIEDFEKPVKDVVNAGGTSIDGPRWRCIDLQSDL